jgi:hypothetical protein
MRRGTGLMVLATCLVFSVACLGEGDSPSGIGEGLFAQHGLDARAAALGGAMVAVARGSAMGYYNPAGLSSLDSLQVAGLYCTPYGQGFDMVYQYASLLGPLGAQTESRKGIGVEITWAYSTIGDIQLWDEEGYAGTAEASGSVWMGSLGACLPSLDRLCIGGSVKYYAARLLEGRGTGMGFDIGLLKSFELDDDTRITVGVNCMDIAGSHIRWESVSGSTDNIMAWTNRAGFAVEAFDRRVLVTCDVELEVSRSLSDLDLHLGAEVRVAHGLAFRAGWAGSSRSGGNPAAGIGLVVKRFAIDYAYVPGRVFGDTHILSAAVVF